MRGIPEERLLEIKQEWFDKYGLERSMIIDQLIAEECKELNPWLPIDENIKLDT